MSWVTCHPKLSPAKHLPTILEMMGKRDAADERADLAQDALYFAQGEMGIGQMLKNLGHDDNVVAVAFKGEAFVKIHRDGFNCVVLFGMGEGSAIDIGKDYPISRQEMSCTRDVTPAQVKYGLSFTYP